MNPNESTVFLQIIIITSALASIFHIRAIIKYNKKAKRIEDNKPYITHLEAIIKEYERISIRQNAYLKNDNDDNASQ